jgi:hypothetical protein
MRVYIDVVEKQRSRVTNLSHICFMSRWKRFFGRADFGYTAWVSPAQESDGRNSSTGAWERSRRASWAHIIEIRSIQQC